MSIFHAVILGIIEGLTEFLPISSTGHLLAANHLFGIEITEFVKSFNIYIQLGAILAVVVLYFKKLITNRKNFFNVVMAFNPTAVIGLVLYPFIKRVLLENLLIVALALIAGGIVLIIFELYNKKRGPQDKSLSIRRSIIIGICQALAVIPGVSRSGATIIGGMLLGISRKDIVEFSFLLAIPTMFAATGLDLIKSDFSFSNNEWLLISIGFIVSFLTALAAIKWFISFVSKHSFSVFGWYRIIVGLLILAFILT